MKYEVPTKQMKVKINRTSFFFPWKQVIEDITTRTKNVQKCNWTK
jgi:hypothetical protein